MPDPFTLVSVNLAGNETNSLTPILELTFNKNVHFCNTSIDGDCANNFELNGDPNGNFNLGAGQVLPSSDPKVIRIQLTNKDTSKTYLNNIVEENPPIDLTDNTTYTVIFFLKTCFINEEDDSAILHLNATNVENYYNRGFTFSFRTNTATGTTGNTGGTGNTGTTGSTGSTGGTSVPFLLYRVNLAGNETSDLTPILELTFSKNVHFNTSSYGFELNGDPNGDFVLGAGQVLPSSDPKVIRIQLTNKIKGKTYSSAVEENPPINLTDNTTYNIIFLNECFINDEDDSTTLHLNATNVNNFNNRGFRFSFRTNTATGVTGVTGATGNTGVTGNTGNIGGTGSINVTKSFTTNSGAVTISDNNINIDLSNNPLEPNTTYVIDLSGLTIKDSMGNIIPLSTLPTFTFMTSNS